MRIRNILARRSLHLWQEAMLAALLPCLPLFDFSQVQDHNDWFNHTWIIAYMGVYLREHFAFPEVLNSHQAIGLPMPVFYGFGFYPALALVTTLFTPQVAVLVAAFGIFSLQYAVVALAVRRLNLPRWLASGAALCVTFAAYPLTNLYNRNAMTEFFGHAELVIALCCLVLCFISEGRRQKNGWYILALIMYGFMASTHPITLRISAEFLVIFCLLLLVMVREGRKDMFLRLAALPLVMLAWLSPWLYALYATGGRIGINSLGVLMYPDDIDTFTMRFSPVLFDRRFWHPPFPNINQISTPFLDAPFNLFLLGMAVVVLAASFRQFKQRAKLLLFTAIMAVCWGIFAWCSLSTEPYGRVVPQGYLICQFAYRMVNMVNFVALAALLGAGAWLKGRSLTPVFGDGAKLAVMALATMASCAFAQKMIHVSSMLRPREQAVFMTQQQVKALAFLPASFYSVPFYTSKDFYTDSLPRHAPQADKAIAFPVGNASLGGVEPITFTTEHGGWYMTNVYAFVWNKVMADGREAPVQVFPHDSFYLNIYLPPGAHRLEYVFDAPPLLRVFRCLSLATVLLLAGMGVANGLAGRQKEA